MTGDLEFVQLMEVESGDDYIVSFYVTEPDDPMAGRTISLIRDKKFEFLIEEQDKGVRASDERLLGSLDEEDNFLEGIRFSASLAEIKTTHWHCKLDLRKVDKAEIRAAKKVLKKMHFDKRFKLTVI